MCQFCDQQVSFPEGSSYLERWAELDDFESIGRSKRRSGRLNRGAQLIKGTNQSDTLLGTAKADTLRGLGGNDKLEGRGGQDYLLGGSGNDSILGGNGNDKIDGGAGQNRLVGGKGKDTFILKKLDGRLANIQDFETDRDRLLIDRGGFKLSLGTRTVAASRFVIGDRAVKASQRFVYQRRSGQLYFDPDGNGQRQKVKIASLRPNTKLQASDLVLSGDSRQTIAPNSSQSDFDIKIKYRDTGLSNSQKNIFNAVAQRWERVITGDVPNVRLGSGRIVDDIEIDVFAPSIDGTGRILGQAGPTGIRSSSRLPYAGVIEFDRADLKAAESDGILDELITHEIGHVLGFGSLWASKGLIEGAGGSNPRYIGSRALKEFNDRFGLKASSIPVENRGGVGTRDFHWRESVFQNELMSGFLGQGSSPLSRISIGAIADLGYQVNFSAADPYR